MLRSNHFYIDLIAAKVTVSVSSKISTGLNLAVFGLRLAKTSKKSKLFGRKVRITLPTIRLKFNSIDKPHVLLTH